VPQWALFVRCEISDCLPGRVAEGRVPYSSMCQGLHKYAKSEGAKFGPGFAGASPVLRAFAYASALSLMVGWTLLFLARFKVSDFSFDTWVVGLHLVAFVGGLSSLSPLGAVCAALVVLTLLAVLTFASGGASC
jgi:hypothetical protein